MNLDIRDLLPGFELQGFFVVVIIDVADAFYRKKILIRGQIGERELPVGAGRSDKRSGRLTGFRWDLRRQRELGVSERRTREGTATRPSILPLGGGVCAAAIAQVRKRAKRKIDFSGSVGLCYY